MEIFSSVQGEGPDVGASTLFVRLGECDLRCRWCDSRHTWTRAAHCRIERVPGQGVFDEVANPIPVERALEEARRLEAASHRFASLTGGEPLLQPEATAELARGLRALGPRIHLETHGLHAGALERVVDAIDVVSMDWKLASDVRRASDPPRGRAADFHASHASFLEVARRAPRVVVKLVITPGSEDAEIDEAAARVAAVHPAACLVLQPVTPCGGVRKRPSAARMLALERRLSRIVRDVRVIPQTHPVYGAP